MSNGRSGREPELTDLEAVAREASRCERWAAEIDAEGKIGSEWARGFSAAMGDIVKLCDQMRDSGATLKGYCNV